MKKLIIALCLSLLLLGTLNSLSAQTQPEVSVILNTDSAGQNEIITADVVVRSDDVIIGADIGITVGVCLRVEGRENGRYLPTTAEESGFVPFEELTESGTRLAANVLGQEVVANPAEYFFRVSLRVLCDRGQADVTVTFAQLVNKDLESYKLAEDQITTTGDTVTLQAGEPVDDTAQVFPTPTEFLIPTPTPAAATEEPTLEAMTDLPTPVPIEAPPLESSDDDDMSLILIIAIIALFALVLVLLIVLVVVLRRPRQD